MIIYYVIRPISKNEKNNLEDKSNWRGGFQKIFIALKDIKSLKFRYFLVLIDLDVGVLKDIKH